MRRTLPPVAALLLAALGSAQTTWIVDPSGSGGAFTTIQAALNAAAHGDTIVVRAGTYADAMQTGKGVMVACDPGVVITNNVGPLLTLTNVPAGRTFTLRGVQAQWDPRILVRSCVGAVHLEEVALPPGELSANTVTVEDSVQVTMTDCAMYGRPAAAVLRSRLVLTGCTVESSPYTTPAYGMTVDHSDVTIVGGRFVGGDFATWWGLSFAAAPAIEVNGGTLVLAGRDTSVEAGVELAGTPVSAIHARAGRVDVDPAVTLLTRNGAPGISGPATVVTRRIPSVRGAGLTSFATWTLDLHAPTGDPFCLYAGLPQRPATTPFGELWFAPSAVVVLACGAVGPGDQVLLGLGMAELPRGVAVLAQGAVVLSSGLVLTTPSVNVAR